jgi:AraC family transcriptional regulator, positive regulator of tynA and feaB
MQVITTEGVPPGERLEFWRDIVARGALLFRIEPLEDDAWHAEMRVAAIGGLALVKFESAFTARYSRTRAEIARSQAPYYFMQLQLDGRCQLQRGEEQFSLVVGDGFVEDPLREFEMTFAAPDNPPRRTLVIGFPKEALTTCIPRPELLHGAVLRRNRPLARLLAGYLLNGFDVADDLTPEAASLFGEHAVELLTQSLRESWAEAPQPSDAWREALFVRACRLVKLRHGDPRLAPEPLARELGVSTRLLHRIFAEHGATVMKRIFAERLNRAENLLSAPEAAHRTVTDIAFSCGFNDSSHFGRVFAAHKSMTPTEWRRRGNIRATMVESKSGRPGSESIQTESWSTRDTSMSS